jgi:hypothetical protein
LTPTTTPFDEKFRAGRAGPQVAQLTMSVAASV